MLKRLALICVLGSSAVAPAAAQQLAPPSPPAPQPAPSPAPQPVPYSQPQPQPAPMPVQPVPSGQPAPAQPSAAGPGAYAPAPGYEQAPGYPQPYGAAAAEPETVLSSVEGAFQLSLLTPFFRFTSTSDEVTPGFDVTESQVDWGLGNGLAIEGGYGLTDKLVLGGRLQLFGTSASREENDLPARETDTLELLIAPKIDYHFIPTSRFNPFAGALVGLNVLDLGGGADAYFVFMARGGVRCFVAENFSIDPSFEIGFGVGPQFAFRLGLMFGVSAWFN